MFKFSDIKYEHPNIEQIKASMNKYIAKFPNCKSYDEARTMYISHEKDMEKLSSMYTVAHIRNTIDTSDKFYENEMNFFYEELPALELIQSEENKLLLSSPYKADFEKEFGSDLIKKMEAEIRLADESIVPEKIEESKLCQEYSKIVASCSTPFGGEDCNFYGLLKHMQSTDRNTRMGAYIAWANMYEGISDKLDDIYLRLVSIRKTIAKKLGFKSYVEVAYLSNGHFYYNSDDVAKFREQVVDVVVPVSKKLFESQAKRIGVDKLHYYDEQLVFPEGNADPIGDMDYLVNSARDMYRQMSKETGEFFDFMCQHELFDLQTKPAKHMGGYCTFIEEYKAPFIFSNFNGTSADVDVLTHEAGHAFQAYTAAKRVTLSSQIWSTNEISEIHSMTMEHFAYPYMDKFFGKNADKYRYAHLSEAFKTVPYLCLVDHFQHEVFAHDYDAKGLRACWHKLEKIYLPWRDYDGNKFLEEGGFWMQKQHIFLYPFYYIDYALAQMGAFEYYTRYKENPEKAWKDYYNLCKAGGSESYFKLLSLGNLSNPFEKGSVKKACAGVIEELDKNTP